MKLGDLGFFYHSVTEKQIVGIVEVIKEYFANYFKTLSKIKREYIYN